MKLRDRIIRDGYAVASGVLSASEVSRLRDALFAHFATRWRWEGLGKHQPDAASRIPAISWLFTHPGIVGLFQEICEGMPVFTSNCDAHMDMLSWWHKDSSAGWLSLDDFALPACGIYRAGVYLQDQPRGGLSVRHGSHRHPDLRSGAAEYLETRAGDVVLFDIRLTHAGQFIDPVETLLLRLGRHFGRPAAAARAKTLYNRLKRRPEKLSIFFTYGDDRSPKTAEFCRYELASKGRSTTA